MRVISMAQTRSAVAVVMFAARTTTLGLIMQPYWSDHHPSDLDTLAYGPYVTPPSLGLALQQRWSSGGSVPVVGAFPAGTRWVVGPTTPRVRTFQLPLVQFFYDASWLIDHPTCYGWLVATAALGPAAQVQYAARFDTPLQVTSPLQAVEITVEIDLVSLYQS